MESIRVIMRFRGGERGAEEDFAPYIITDKSIKLPPKDHEYSYDAVVGSAQSQKDTYDIGAKQMIKDFMDGFNATIFCYGQSGSGKTFSMLGPEDVTEVLVNGIDVVPEETQEMYGIIPRATFDIFDYMNEGIKVSTQFNIKVSYIEIYNEAINDILCNPTNTNLNLREFPNLGMCVVGMVERTITEEAGVFECLSLGTANRIVCATGQNARSSRSHTVFIILVEQKLVDGSTKISKLNLVDLAGSEKIAKTGATGQSLKEAQKINLSLTTLGRCIKALTSDAKHIPFRESKLTLILKESLGGNAKTCLLVTASRKKVHKEETVGTMQFAERAKQIKSKAKQNAKKSPEELERLVAELQREVATLKRKLTESGGVIDIADMPAAGEGEEGELSTVADSEEGDVSLDTSAAYTELKVSFENYKEHSEREMLELQAALDQAKDSTNTIDHVAHREEIDMHIDRVKEVERQLSVSQKDKEMIRVDLESQLEDAQNKEKELTGNLDRTKTLKDKLEQNLEEAQSRLIQKDEELENLRDTSASSKSEIANLLAQIEELKKRIAELTESENALKITVSAQHEEIKALKQRIADLEKQLRDKESDLKTISQKLEDAMARETEFQAEIEAQKKAKHAINQLMQDKDQQLQELEKSHEETVAAAAEAKHQASQRESYLTTKIMSTETEIASMKQMLKENATTQEMLAAQEKQSQEIKTEYEKTLARERQESATAADALKSELETLKTAKNAEIQEARQELEVAKAGADVTKDKLDTATNQLSTTKSELLDLKNTDEKKKSKIDSLSNQVLQLSQDFVTKSDELKKVTDELDSMKKIENEKAAQNQVSAEEYEKEIKERDQKIADLKKRINSQQGAIKSKDQTLDKIEENMRYETSKYTEDIKLKNSTVNEQRKSIGNLEGQLSDLRTKLTNITSELRDEKRRTDSARKQSIANLHSENFGRRKTIVRSQPQIAASINQAQSGSKFNPFGVTLKKTSYGHQEQAVQEAKRASQLGASSEFKVYYGADLIKALYSNDSDEEQQAMVRRQSTGPIAEDNEDSANSSDSYSDSEPLEEAKVAADS